jgi:cobalt/nickel transport system permease protein
MIDELYFIEKHAYRQSIIHRLDARIKLLIAFSVIIAIVAVPYSPKVIQLGGVFFVFFLCLWVCTKLSPLVYLKRLLLILPFGIFLIVFQIFFKNGFYDVFHPIATFPLGITVYAESVEFASILFVKFIVSISFIILLSSTTKMQEMIDASGRLGLPVEFTLTLGMMVRYLFVFAEMIGKIGFALASRNFDPFDRSLPYRYRLQRMGYTIGMMFIRSYEQGERTYTSMLCRGYGAGSQMHIGKRALKVGEISFLACTIAFIVVAAIVVYLPG